MNATQANLRPAQTRVGVLLLAALLSSCSLGYGTSSGHRSQSEAEWRALGTPRPTPLSGATRLTVTSFDLGDRDLDLETVGIDASVAVLELATAGLLRRRDVHFVERRRFSVAAAAERTGLEPPAGRPPVGISVGAEFAAAATYAEVTTELASLEVRLTSLQTGEVVGATRLQVTPGADAVQLGRSMVSGILAVLDELNRRPLWDDPMAATRESERVREDILANFLQGLAYEEVWDWEEAREAYQAAVDVDFPEAAAALARTARLRLGGTLAES